MNRMTDASPTMELCQALYTIRLRKNRRQFCSARNLRGIFVPDSKLPDLSRLATPTVVHMILQRHRP